MITSWYKYGNGYKIKFDYDTELVERLKAMIPHTARQWDDVSKEWWVSAEYIDALDKLFPGFKTMVKSQLTIF